MGCFRAHIAVPQGISRTWRWFLLSTRTLHDIGLCGRAAGGGEEPDPLPLRCGGSRHVGPVTQHRCARRGTGSSSAGLPLTCCAINSDSRVESRGNVGGIQWFFFYLGLVLPCVLLFLLPVREDHEQNLGTKLGLASFPELKDFSHWCLPGEGLHVCVLGEAMNQQFNYALFRKFSPHPAPGKVFPPFYLYVSKNAWISR